MNQTLLKTHKVQCKWFSNVYMQPFSERVASQALEIYAAKISEFTNHLEVLRSFLDAKELLKSENYILSNDRTRYTVARSVLKKLLSKHLNKHPSDLRFYYENNLKPRVESMGDPLHYNISHSGDWIFFAIANQPVGIDAEHIDLGFNYGQIMDVTFSRDEIDYIHESNNQQEAFYLLWTRKEALLKATGKGIDNDLPFIPARSGEHEVDSVLTGSENDWNVGSFGFGSDYIVSLAQTGNETFGKISINKISPELFSIEGKDL